MNVQLVFDTQDKIGVRAAYLMLAALVGPRPTPELRDVPPVSLSDAAADVAKDVPVAFAQVKLSESPISDKTLNSTDPSVSGVATEQEAVDAYREAVKVGVPTAEIVATLQGQKATRVRDLATPESRGAFVVVLNDKIKGLSQ